MVSLLQHLKSMSLNYCFEDYSRSHGIKPVVSTILSSAPQLQSIEYSNLLRPKGNHDFSLLDVIECGKLEKVKNLDLRGHHNPNVSRTHIEILNFLKNLEPTSGLKLWKTKIKINDDDHNTPTVLDVARSIFESSKLSLKQANGEK